MITLSLCTQSLSKTTQKERATVQQKPSQYNPVLIAEIWTEGASWPAEDTFNLQLGSTNQLQPNGLRMQYALGQAVQALYKDSIFSQLTHNDVTIFSSESNPTILSAFAHIQGLIPQTYHKNITNNVPSTRLYPWPADKQTNFVKDPKSALPFNTVIKAVHSIPKKEDKVFMTGIQSICPNAFKFQQGLMMQESANSGSLIQTISDAVAKAGYPCSKYFPKCSGTSKGYNLTQLADFSQAAISYYYQTGGWPKGVDADLGTKLTWFDVFGVIAKNFEDPAVGTLYSSDIAEQIVEEFDSKIAGDKGVIKFLGYSAPKETITGFLLGFQELTQDCVKQNLQNSGKKVEGTRNGQNTLFGRFGEVEGATGCPVEAPGFGSNLIFELSLKNDSFYHRVLYNGKVIKSCQDPNKDGYCDYEIFRTNFLKLFGLTSKQFAAACAQITGKSMFWVWISAMLLAVLVFLLIFSFCCLSSNLDSEIELSKEFSKEYSEESQYEYEIDPITGRKDSLRSNTSRI